jgi:hypothetical protein
VAAGALSVIALAGCVGSSPAPASLPARTSTPVATSPAATSDPLDACTHQLEYWAEQILADFDDPGWDYQEMGLSSAKYTELLDVVAAARTVQAASPLPPDWLREHLQAACARVLALPPRPSDAVGWP